MGLNLTQADTVIFFDSDFNPQSDLQAQARVHRIGQTQPVKVIRLVAQHTVEELILKRAFLKLRLTQAVIDEGNFSLVFISLFIYLPSLTFLFIQEQELGKLGGLNEVLKYGLREIVGNQASNISDEDIDVILQKGVVRFFSFFCHVTYWLLLGCIGSSKFEKVGRCRKSNTK